MERGSLKTRGEELIGTGGIRPTAKVEVLALEKSLDFSKDKKNLKEMLLRDNL